MESYRYKLRNCIREGTFRYVLDHKKIEAIWMCLEEKYGRSKELHGFGLLTIENEKLLIRRDKKGNTFTLIKKRKFVKQDEDFIHEIIGMVA